jgi:predicted NUDIX family phosphoesterase
MPEIDNYMEEHVLVVPRTLLEKAGMFQGLQYKMEGYSGILTDPKNHSFRKRKEVETDRSLKQLIPYAILKCKDEVFVYRRGEWQGEKRLYGNYSLGVGGHISISDAKLIGITYEEGLLREVKEEVTIRSPYTKSLAGLLNDDSNDVGKVHLGVVHVFDLERPDITSNETSLVETCFMKPEELRAKIDQFENWSKICIEHIEELIA